MRVVQLSDCHLSAQDNVLYRGIDPRQSLERLLQQVSEFSPELVIATGDLSEDASDASYSWLAGALSGLAAQVVALPGNHDDPYLLRAYFPGTTVDEPLVVEHEDWQFILLNSAVKNEVPGRIDEQQLKQLDRSLLVNPAPTLVSLHHQPLLVGSQWIDRYPLLDPGPFWEVLRRHPSVRLLTWGHIHHAVTFHRGGITALGSPSTVSNTLPRQEKFVYDPAGPSCRWFELESNGSFETGLLFAD